MHSFLTICATILLFVHSSRQALPFGIKPCKSDGKLNECAEKTAKSVIKEMVKGDPKHKIPVLDPLRVDKIWFTDSPGKPLTMNFSAVNVVLYGFKDAELIKSEMNVAKQIIRWTFKTKQVKLMADYWMSGKFLVVPLTGKGKAVAILEEPIFTYSSTFKIIKKNGKDYLKLNGATIDYKLKKLSMNFENLLGGDKTLSKNINEVLNENWQEFDNQFGPSVAKAVLQVLHNLLKEITKDYSFDEIFPKP